MSTPEGWYADPQRPGVPGAERWWNGASWTAHTREAEAAPGPPPPPSPPGRPVGSDPALQQGFPRQVRSAGDLATAISDALFSLWDQVTRNPVARDRSTADGEVLAPPVTRGVAWVIDLVLVAALVRLVHVLVEVARFLVDVADGSAHWSTGQGPSWVSLLAGLVAAFGYHALFLRARGATPGKLFLGLVVRTVDSPGRLPWAVVLKRVLLSTLDRAHGLLALAPVVGGLSLLLAWWPWVDRVAVLATSRQQALHDLWAGTQVVQRPRGALLRRRR